VAFESGSRFSSVPADYWSFSLSVASERITPREEGRGEKEGAMGKSRDAEGQEGKTDEIQKKTKGRTRLEKRKRRKEPEKTKGKKNKRKRK
jgi:hypothetical protein